MPPWPIVDEYFYTERWAKIKDRRLTIPYTIGWWITLGVGLFSLFFQGGYLELDDELRGVLRPRLNNRPDSEHHKPFPDGNFSPRIRTGEAEPAYCQDNDSRLGVTGWDGATIGCEHWDPFSASRAMGPDGIFVATRLHERHQISVCHANRGRASVFKPSSWASKGSEPRGPIAPSPCRDEFETEWVQQAFLEDVESFVMQVDGNIEAHTFAAASTICGDRIVWGHDNVELEGALVGPATPCRNPIDWYRSWEGIKAVLNCHWDPPEREILQNIAAGKKDLFPLHMWLAAAGVSSLDDRTDARKTKPGRDTFRHEGMVLEAYYEYSNTGGTSFLQALLARLSCTEPAPFTYMIKVERVKRSEFKMEEIVLQDQETSCDLSCPPSSTAMDRANNYDVSANPDRCCGTRRVVHRMHGLLIKFRHSGTAGQFSFLAVPSYLFYALGSVAIIKSVLDLMWSVVFPYVALSDYCDDIYMPAVKRSGSGSSGYWKKKLPAAPKKTA
jgi:hypothetical protein